MLILRNTESFNILSSVILSITYFAAAQNMAAHTVFYQVMGMYMSHQKYSALSTIQWYGWKGGAQVIDKHR